MKMRHAVFTRLFPFFSPAILFLLLTANLGWAEPFKLADPGTERVVDYGKYGKFENAGKYGTQYTITDQAGLAKASGEGIDPNRSVWGDPAFKNFKDQGKLRGSVWEHVHSGNPQADFYAWATANDDPGLRLLFMGKALEDAGHYEHALKAYRAAMILYPKSYGWSRERTFTWLIAPGVWGSIIHLTRDHPELQLKLVDALVQTQPAIGGDPTKNDVAITPGQFMKYTLKDKEKSRVDITKLKAVQRRGGKVACVKYENGQWGLEVDGKPFLVQGVSYLPTRVGKNYSWNWMDADENHNGSNDVAYETWIDKNRNGVQDPDEPAVGDFKLLQEMGCNAIRILTPDDMPLNLPLLRDMQKSYGIYGFLNDPFGAYTIHSGATWDKGTDYRDPEQRKSMLEAVRKMVEQCKDEPWLLAYVLGNENNMPGSYAGVNATRTNASVYPEDYASLLNDAAALIHKLDPNHPVGVGNVGVGLIDVYAKKAPELDFMGVNDYPGAQGFGGMWEVVRHAWDRPILVTEYGCDAYWTDRGPDEDAQANYHRKNWEDIAFNRAGEPGSGNSIGGVEFEWLDEWYKDTPTAPDVHDTKPTLDMAFPDGWSQEEWLGICGQGNGQSSPFLREPRKAYDYYKSVWRNK